MVMMTEPLRTEALKLHDPINPRLPHITRKVAKKKCSDCGRGTALSWENGYAQAIGGLKYRLCQACAKKRGPPYDIALRNFLNNNWLDETEGEAGGLTDADYQR